MELGHRAIAFFPSITPQTPAEVKERLGRVKSAFEKAIAAAAADPSRITLSGKHSLADAFAALEQQSGNQVTGYDGRDGTVEVDFKDTRYWEAIDQLLDQVDLNINIYGGEANTLVLSTRADGEIPRFGNAVYEGVFRFEPQRVAARRDFRNPMIGGLDLTLNVTWEPRVRPISLQQQLEGIQAVDDQGEAIEVAPSRRVANTRIDTGMSGVELGIPLSLPNRKAQKIASLKGTLTALVPGGQEEFEFTDLAESRDVERQKAGVTVVYERLRRNQALYEVRIRVRFEEAGQALRSNYSWIFENEAFVLDADGEKFDNLNPYFNRNDETEIGVVYLFALPDGPEGCRFIYRTPASILRLQVEYELNDIELP